MLTQAHIYIKGDVIGVGMRGWVRVHAKSLNVTGWARNVFNKPDLFGKSGGVEAILQGSKRAIDDLVDLVKKNGTIGHIHDIEVYYQDPKEIFEDFLIRKSESFLHK